MLIEHVTYDHFKIAFVARARPVMETLKALLESADFGPFDLIYVAENCEDRCVGLALLDDPKSCIELVLVDLDECGLKGVNIQMSMGSPEGFRCIWCPSNYTAEVECLDTVVLDSRFNLLADHLGNVANSIALAWSSR